MAQSEQQPAESPFEDATVVDHDVHLGWVTPMLLKEFAKRMDEPYASYVHPDKGMPITPTAGYPRMLGGKKASDSISDAETAEQIDADLCKQFGIDHPILNSLVPLDKVFQDNAGVQLMRASNDVLIEQFLDKKDHFYGLASIATREPDKAAEEIDRVADEDGIIGAFFPIGHRFKLPAGDPDMDIIYQALEDNGLTPVFHPGTGEQKFPVMNEFETFFSVHSLGFHWGGMKEVTSLIAQGVPEKFPDLDFVFVETGLEWVPATMFRLNREYGQYAPELPLLEKSPEEYMRESFYFANQAMSEPNDPRHLQQLFDILGPEMIIFSTDFPHFDFDHPRSFVDLLDFSPEGREKVLHGNSKKIFDLSI